MEPRETLLREAKVQSKRSTRSTRSLSRLRDYVTCMISCPNQDYIFYDKVSTKHMTFLCSVDQVVEPGSYNEAKDQPIWNTSMSEELKLSK
jgi:hypothetical protein